VFQRIAFIARKEFQYFWMDWESYLWAIAIPVLFMYFIGTVTSQFGGSGSGGAKDVLAVVASPDDGLLADQMVDRLAANGYDVKRCATAEQAAPYARKLHIPTGFTAGVLAGQPHTVRLEPGEQGVAGSYDQYRVGRAVYSLLADLTVCAQDGQDWTAATIGAVARAPRNVTIDVRPAGRRQLVPSGFEQAVPGILIMFSLLVGLSSTSGALVIERLQGRLKRLACSPISRGEVFAGKWLARLAIGFLQVLVGMVVGRMLFGVQWGPDLWAVLIVLLAWCALCASAGLLLGSLVRTEAQGIGISVLAANALCALGGLWWPIEVTPGWMQKLATGLPTGWTMQALHQLSLFRAGPSSAIPCVVALCVTAVVVGMLGARQFRFQ
jgi:ABC-type Na+ efflux pump permease subunit